MVYCYFYLFMGVPSFIRFPFLFLNLIGNDSNLAFHFWKGGIFCSFTQCSLKFLGPGPGKPTLGTCKEHPMGIDLTTIKLNQSSIQRSFQIAMPYFINDLTTYFHWLDRIVSYLSSINYMLQGTRRVHGLPH